MKALIFSFLIAAGLTATAQHDYFILIQSEQRQPFYVRMNENTYSSSSIGHLLLSKFSDTTYQIYIGFPKNQFPEQQFVIKINRKDHGFQLKNLGDKGWALFNLQTLELLPSQPRQNLGSGGGGYSLVRKSDNFAKLMSRVVNDTAVMYAILYDQPPPIVAKQESAAEEKKIIEEAKRDAPKDSAVVTKVQTNAPETMNSNQPTKEAVLPPVVPVKDSGLIVKPAEVVTKNEVKQDPPAKEESLQATNKEIVNKPKNTIYISKEQDRTNGLYRVMIDGKDSVDIFIEKEKEAAPLTKAPVEPEKKTEISPKEKQEKPKEADSKTELKEESQKTQPKVEEKKPEIVVEAKKDPPKADPIIKEETKTPVEEPKPKLVLINSDCKSFAMDSDLDKLRVKMLPEKDVDDRISVARKGFKAKCFTAAQIKALSELFRDQDSKYKFLDAAYPFVSDAANFKELVYLFTDDYYVKRFKAMVRMD